MKDYKQLIKELPAKSVVFAFGRFNPPTIGHELLVKAVKKLAQQRNADHVIYASRSQDAKKNPLSVEKKVKYLKLMFKSTNFAAANDQERTFIEAAKALNKKYKNIIMIAGSDRIAEFKRLLNTYNGKDFNFDTIEVVSAGERDPDADDATGMSASKMRSLAVKGSYSEFKNGLPSTVRDIDGKRLMNDIRDGMGLEPIKEQIILVKDKLREKFFRGEIFNEGDIVESAGERFTIVKRGSNHLLLKEASGNLVSKWIQDIQPTEEKEDMNEALTDKTLRPTDKIKVARIIATMLGVDNAETSSNPENLINQALRKVRTKSLNPEALHILDKMLNLATEQGIQYDATLKPSKLKEGVTQIGGTDKIETTTDSVVVNKNSKYNLAQGILRFNDFKKLQKMNSVKEKHEETPGQPSQIGITLASDDSTDNLRRRKIKYHLGEQDDKAAKETAKANLMAKHAKEKESLADKHTREKESMSENNLPSVPKDKTSGLPKKYVAGVSKSTAKARAAHFAKADKLSDSDPEAYKPAPGDATAKTKPSKHTLKYRAMFGEDMDEEIYEACWDTHKQVGMKKKGNRMVPDCVPKNEETEVCPVCGKSPCECEKPTAGPVTTDKPFDPFFKEDEDEFDFQEPSDDEIESMADELSDDDYLDTYEDDELGIVDDETGEELPEDEEEEKKLKESALMEVLSRIERMKARTRIRRTSAKRERATKIALKRYSNTATINKRARRLAIKLMKKRLLRGRDPSKVSVGEKERIERTLEKRKAVIGRIATRLAPRVRKVEKARLSHTKYTQGSQPSVF